MHGAATSDMASLADADLVEELQGRSKVLIKCRKVQDLHGAATYGLPAAAEHADQLTANTCSIQWQLTESISRLSSLLYISKKRTQVQGPAVDGGSGVPDAKKTTLCSKNATIAMFTTAFAATLQRTGHQRCPGTGRRTSQSRQGRRPLGYTRTC